MQAGCRGGCVDIYIYIHIQATGIFAHVNGTFRGTLPIHPPQDSRPSLKIYPVRPTPRLYLAARIQQDLH